jgi:hypothetical protein
MFEVKPGRKPESNYRFSLLITGDTGKAIEACRRKLGFENKSMVVRRAMTTYIKQNLTGEELKEVANLRYL